MGLTDFFGEYCMRIKWYGTATLLIEAGNTRILVDPYLKKYNPALPPIDVEEAAGADAAFITHPHFDHFADIGVFLEAGLKKVFVSEEGIAHAQANGIPDGRMIPLAANEKIAVGDVTVRTFQSRHCKFDASTVLSVALNPATYLFHFRDGVNILKQTKKFRIEETDILALEFSAEGKKIMTLGSAGMDENVEYPDGADLLVFPYQGRAHMHKYMVSFLKEFAPKAIMIDHFDNAFPPLTHAVDVKKFLPTVKKYLPQAKAFRPEEGVWYEV